MRARLYYISIVVCVWIAGCAKPFNPPEVSANANILVVEGLINIGTDSTIFKLSRTVIIGNKTSAAPETKATVTIENAQGTSYALPEKVKGTYAAAPLNLDNTKKYRLRIKTANGKTYLSDLVDPKITPPIDSIGFTIKNGGIQIYANAHDVTNNTRYYKYDYSEAWQFNARYPTSFISDGININARTPAQQIFYCYGRDSSANTVVNSTTSLSQDVAYQFPITSIDSSSEKIGTKYSILLSQIALTKDAYLFWDNIRKNTEQLGSIFDAQPTQLPGNIYNIADPSDPVIGFISAATIQKKRVYIVKTQLPQAWAPTYPFSCKLDLCVNTNNPPVPPKDPDLQWAKTAVIYLPVHGFVTSIVSPIYPAIYEYTTPECADCTIRGQTQKPVFWK